MSELLDPEAIPADFPVRPIDPDSEALDPATCGTCGLTWDDGICTSWTPVPSGRCPFEHFHVEIETDEQKERRLSRQANEVCLGVLRHPEIPAKVGQYARVEVTYQADEESREEAGFFRCYFPAAYDPYETAYELVEAELERRFPDASYVSVDDVLSR